MSPNASGAPSLSRRRVLVAAGLGLVAGSGALAACTGAGSAGPTPDGPSGSSSAPADVDAALRAEVAEQEVELAARYAAAVAAYPDLADRLAVGDRHTSYAAAVTDTPPTAGAAIGVPARATLMRRLRAAERRAARARLVQCGRAQDPELARVLALIGAGCAAAATELAGT